MELWIVQIILGFSLEQNAQKIKLSNRWIYCLFLVEWRYRFGLLH